MIQTMDDPFYKEINKKYITRSMTSLKMINIQEVYHKSDIYIWLEKQNVFYVTEKTLYNYNLECISLFIVRKTFLLDNLSLAHKNTIPLAIQL